MKDKLLKFSRYPSRAVEDKDAVYAMLDEAKMCHISYQFEGHPVMIPTIFGRIGNTIYLHGSVKSRSMMYINQCEICFCVSHLDDLVLARTALDHSMNYRSVIAYAKPRLVTEKQEKLKALEAIINQILPARWNEVDAPTDNDLAATAVHAFELEKFTAKQRNAGPGDENKPQKDVWAGLVPLKKGFEAAVPDEFLDENVPVPESVKELFRISNK